MSRFFDILLWPLTAFLGLVGRNTKAAIAIGSLVTVLAIVTRHGAWAAGAAMFVGTVLVWLSESNTRRQAEQSAAVGE